MIYGKMSEALLQDCQRKIKRPHYPPKYPAQFLLLCQAAHSGGRSMRAVKNNPLTLSEEVGESEDPRRGNWRVSACQWVGG